VKELKGNKLALSAFLTLLLFGLFFLFFFGVVRAQAKEILRDGVVQQRAIPYEIDNVNILNADLVEPREQLLNKALLSAVDLPVGGRLAATLPVNIETPGIKLLLSSLIEQHLGPLSQPSDLVESQNVEELVS
jgi:hypothetical protein